MQSQSKTTKETYIEEQISVKWKVRLKGKVQHWYLVMYSHFNPVVFKNLT